MVANDTLIRVVRRQGFTVVELLVVIVTIAILAAISTVVYAGIQVRSTNAARISAAQSFHRAIELYVTEHDRMPGDPGAYGSCLGRNSANICYGVSADDIANNRDSQVDPVLDDDLLTVINQIPSVPESPVVPNEGWYTPREIIGPRLLESSSRFVNDEPVPWVMQFWLQGTNVSCGMAVLRDLGWDPGEGRTLYEMGGANTYTLSQAGTTECMVPISISS